MKEVQGFWERKPPTYERLVEELQDLQVELKSPILRRRAKEKRGQAIGY